MELLIKRPAMQVVFLLSLLYAAFLAVNSFTPFTAQYQAR